MTFIEALIVAAVAPLPIVEMRLSIALGHLTYGFPWPLTFGLTLGANLLAVPIVWALLPDFERFCRRSRRLGRWIDWLFARARREASKGKERLEEVGIFVIVALTGLPFPVPGSGLYTALIAAYIFGLSMRKVFPWVAAGCVVAVGALTATVVLVGHIAL